MPELDILLFAIDPELARRAAAAGIAGLVVDWEDRRADVQRTIGESDRRPDTVEDLRRVATATKLRIVCRINPVGPSTAREVEDAIEHGATDILVPMIERAVEFEKVVTLVRERVRVGAMIETVAACRHAAEIARVRPDFVYVGLLDLAVSRGERNVFRPLADGTADRLRAAFAGSRFGIAGVTVVDKGAPVPCEVLLAEVARLRSDFVFARRSFLRDTAGRDLTCEAQRLRAAWNGLIARDTRRTAADHDAFVARFGGAELC